MRGVVTTTTLTPALTRERAFEERPSFDGLSRERESFTSPYYGGAVPNRAPDGRSLRDRPAVAASPRPRERDRRAQRSRPDRPGADRPSELENRPRTRA